MTTLGPGLRRGDGSGDASKRRGSPQRPSRYEEPHHRPPAPYFVRSSMNRVVGGGALPP